MTADRKRLGVTAAIAAAVVFGMTGLAFAAVPLYKAFCQATGFDGTTQTASAAPNQVLDQTISVRFDTNVAPGLAMDFAAEQSSEALKIGATGLAFFHVENTSDRPITAVATYNVTPETTGQYFVKLECFCFNARTLQPGEQLDLPVVYFVDPEFASDPETRGVDTITLSYTYFASTEEAAAALTN